VGGAVDVVAQPLDDESVQLGVPGRHDVEPDDLRFGVRGVPSHDHQHSGMDHLVKVEQELMY
jgi:hypothetical protein